MSYELQPHTADVAIEAVGPSLDAVFEAIADGLAAAHCDHIPAGGDRFTIAVQSENLEALLFDFLDRLIIERDVRNVLPVDHSVTIEHSGPEWQLSATARGVPIDQLHAREIKAVTYSEMVIEETADGWRLYVVLDV